MEVKYSTHKTKFSNCFIATQNDSIIAIEFFEKDESEALQNLRKKFPEAKLTKNTHSKIIQKLFDPQSQTPKIHLSGTPFQIKVWQELSKIPHGKTATYSEIAAKINKPRAHRAVASAIAKNRVAFLIPCHRVIRSDRTLGGYRWGTDLKQKLLTHESKTAST